ncbi:Cell division protein FtsH [[Actinomadura] parvosata subsp. kistnae]|uniref:ATPase n=1 Tax=[Actinomadura] parvosata subsp. kistnae TaxID=1909395 RepID=A0A1U9ZR78_9ACTN|nr:AAA family ATPase [Nonomuraea sp. ATCC 55076]AQZ60450.1 ATPase [Nonomuraea sp. ATCC 55076]SPL91011.1 Cell division protein FtsH [Actinomadura parvosata subsp. kistnae]
MTTTVHHEGLRAPGSGPTDPESVTRKKMQFWDRSKFLIALVLAYLVLTWKVMADFAGIITFPQAAQQIALAYQWIFWLLGAELIRQLHFFVSEHWSGYHRFWSQKVFGGFERWTHRRFDDWTRFRLARALKIAFFVALVALVLGAVLDVSPFAALLQAPALLWQALPFFLQIVFLFFFVIIQFVGLFWFLSRGGVETYFPDDIKTRFHDVWGQDHVVERVQENIVFLERPDEIERRGGYVPSGLLLWGPPGTGKTLMAEAVAGETGKPYVFVDPGAFTNMFMGIGILKVKSLFRKLRKLALRYGGVIVFFDEADSLGKRGRLAQQGPPGQGGGFAGHSTGLDGCHGMSYMSEATRQLLAFRGGRGAEEEPGRRNRFMMGGGMMNSGDPGTLQALLTELSGLKKPRGFFNRLVRRLLGMRPKPPPKYRILVMMATNRPDALDEALLRPGRIDRIYKVGYPSKAGRVRTYQGYFDKVEHELTPEQIDKLATITPYATGATIKDLVNESLITAIRDGREVITWSDVLRAKRLKQLGPPEDVEYIERERHAVAVHEACHAVVAYVTRFHLEIDIATIEKGADYLGMVASIKPEDQFTRWKSEHEADIMVSLASLAGERMFFGEDNSSGVSGDLYSATYLTAMMESYWGMGSGVTSLPALQELEIMGGKAVRKAPGGGGGIGITDREPSRNQPDLTPDVLGERIEFNLVRLLEKTEQLLQEHRREVLCLAHALETHKTLNGDDVVAIIRREPGPLLDGSVYASDELYQELEDYHRDAVRAHKEHSHIERELPGIQEPVAATVSAAPAGQGAYLTPPGGAPVIQAPPPPPGTALPMVPPVGPPVGPPAQDTLAGLPAEQSDRPEFVPWAATPQPAAAPHPVVPVVVGEPTAAPAPQSAGKRRIAGRVWLVVASLLGLVALSVIAALAVTGTLAGGNGSGAAVSGVASPGLLLLLFVVVVAGIVGAGLAFVAIKGIRTAQAKAERERDQAHARAQLLAAAMDPDTAMRLLGYDGNNGIDRRT